MLAPSSSLGSLRIQYLRSATTPSEVLEQALTHANSNAGRNAYLATKAGWTRNEANHLETARLETQPLWGVPVSLKDCFDLTGFPTSCGSSFYRDHNGVAAEDSTVAQRLRAAGAIITGKTHLHQLAYGITGENPDFGDCVQPRNAAWLTGGSSSGAAASVQEGSALAAIGTDTGGSIRVPAALCGLAGYRSSITLNTPALWHGGGHLAPSFDTIGWLYRDLRDGPLLARTFFELPDTPAPTLASLRIGIPDAAWMHDSEPAVLDALRSVQSALQSHGTTLSTFDAAGWDEAMSIFAPIQAHQAAAIHAGKFAHFDPAITERLAWGAAITTEELTSLRDKLATFRQSFARLFERFDYLLLPCCPMLHLAANADHSQTRTHILRYTAPISLAGLPVVTLPAGPTGLQLVGRLGEDAELLALSASLADLATKDATLHP